METKGVIQKPRFPRIDEYILDRLDTHHRAWQETVCSMLNPLHPSGPEMLCWFLAELSRRDHEPELRQGMLAAPLKNTQQQRHQTPLQLEGFAFSTASGHILQHKTLEAGFMGNHVFHVAHDMPGNCTLKIFPKGPSIPWNWKTQSPVKKLLLSETFVCTLCRADCLTAQ